MISILNAIISGLGAALGALISILPTSPFNWTYNIENKFIQQMNYILPLSQAVAHLELYVTGVAIYYGIRIVLKWIKAAGN